MTRLLAFALCTLFFASALQAQEKSYTWIAAPSRGQLERDPTLIAKGKGFLFVPTMTNALNEPSYRVFQGNKEVADANTGTGVMLSPGYYEVYIGSGSIAQMMSRTVEVREELITLVKPFWAGLVINVIEANRTSVNESYELYWQDQQENYGIGFGIEEERGEAVKTWLLPPGVYTVLSVGDNISTTRKFSVRLEPGELVQRNLVIDTNSQSFIGFYPPTLQGLLSQGRSSNWKTSWQLSGSTQFATSQNTTGVDLSVFSLSTQIFGRATYNSDNAFANLRLIFEEGFTREEGDAFRKSIDDFDLRGTYIYRGFSERFGPYLRGELSTKLFATEARFDQQQQLYQVDADGDTTRVLSDVNDFTLSPALSPLAFSQGLGINAQLVRSFQLNLAMRVGLGARQTYVFDTFDLSQDRTSARQIKSAKSTGLEALLVLDSRLSSFISLDSEFDLLIPEVKSKSWEFTWENRWRINLSRFINLDLVVNFERQKPLNRLQSEQQALLRFVYLL
jgi:hypothetical protein